MVDIADLKSAGLNPAPNPNCACKQRGFFNLIFLCVGTSLQHIPPTSYPSIGGIEYAAMVEQVDTADLKSAEE